MIRSNYWITLFLHCDNIKNIFRFLYLCISQLARKFQTRIQLRWNAVILQFSLVCAHVSFVFVILTKKKWQDLWNKNALCGDKCTSIMIHVALVLITQSSPCKICYHCNYEEKTSNRNKKKTTWPSSYTLTNENQNISWGTYFEPINCT